VKDIIFDSPIVGAIRITSALRDDEHQSVYFCLVTNKIYSLTELCKGFDSTYHELKPILDDLIEAGLVDQFVIYPTDNGNLDKRLYRISNLGIRFYVLLLEATLSKISPRRK